MKAKLLVVLLAVAVVPAAHAAQPAPQGKAAPKPVVQAEQEVYRYTPANNGAGPMWCRGSTCLVRIGAHVLAGGLETIAGAKPLNNCRWMLLKCEKGRWKVQQVAKAARTREPTPLVCFPDGRVFMSVNPTLTKPDAYSGPARPKILQFDAAEPASPFRTITPKWQGTPRFTEHSYRSFAADGPRGELVLFQNIGYTHVEWAFRDGKGQWSACGRLAWPWGAQHDKPQPVRICYPNVALKDRAVYFCGVSDIVEPYAKWRDYKRKLTGRKWDYDFRRLFYTSCDDVTKGTFGKWVEIASRDKTCGWIIPCDLWVGPGRAVHLLWSERAIDTRLRKAFFPTEKQSYALNYAVVRGGKVVLRRTLVIGGEGLSAEIPGAGRFHVTPGGRLLVFYYVSGTSRAGKRVSENRLLEIAPDGRPGPHVTVPLKHPFTSFFTATVRAGCRPSWTLDLLGQCAGKGGAIRYARIALGPPKPKSNTDP
jgi:hypothetical protein